MRAHTYIHTRTRTYPRVHTYTHAARTHIHTVVLSALHLKAKALTVLEWPERFWRVKDHNLPTELRNGPAVLGVDDRQSVHIRQQKASYAVFHSVSPLYI